MSIIPSLLPTTKQCGLDCPGYIYSMSGTYATNPLLGATYENGGYPSVGKYLSNENVLLYIGVNTSYLYNSTYQIALILHTSIGNINASIVLTNIMGSVTASYPCGIPSYFNTYSCSRSYALTIDIIEMTKNNIDILYIEIDSYTNSYGMSSVVDSSIFYTYVKNPAILEHSTIIFGNRIVKNTPYTPSLISFPCITSLSSNKKIITLNKSTGFVLTVT